MAARWSIRKQIDAQAVLIGALVVLLQARSAQAVARSWDNSAGDGLAATAANWTPAAVPGAADDLTFSIAGAYPVTWGATVTSSRTHVYRNGTVTNTMSSPHTVSTGITVAASAGEVATMTLTTGTLTSNGSMIVGDSGTGTLNVNDDDADLIIGGTADLTIGNNGDAAMSITGLGHVEVADQFIAGANSVSSPTITISGFQGVFPFEVSRLNVLGTGESRVGQGGDATMTIANGGVATFAGHLIIANGSASVSTVTVHDIGLLPSRLDVDGDLRVGRNAVLSNGILAGTGTLNVDTGGTVNAAATYLGDPDGGTGTLDLGGGTFNGTLPIDMENGSAILGFGTLNADVNVGSGSIVTTGAGINMGGIINCTTAGVFGTIINFTSTGGYTGSGSCATEITGDPAALITATGTLSLGKNVVNGINYDGILEVGAQDVTLLDSNGAVMGGLTRISSGGNLIVPSGLGVELGGRVQGDGGTITANVTNAGKLDPQRSPTPGGIMDITGNLTMNPSGEYDMEIGGTPASNMHDRLNVSGTATFGGTLRVSIPNGYVPKVGEQFIAINATMGRGTSEFASIIPPSPSPCNNVTFVLVYSSTAAIVLVRPPLGCTALGDLNSDGGCSGLDMQEFVDSMIYGPYNSCSDMNGDCVNDPLDIPIFINCLL